MARARLIPDDDVQLWVYADQGWEIPVCAQPCHVEGGHAKLMAVWPALLMNAEPTRVVTLAMQARQASEATGCWVLPDEKFTSCATKCGGINPAYYFRKDGQRIDNNAVRDIAVEISEPKESEKITQSTTQRLAKFLASRTAMFAAAAAESVFDALESLAVEILIGQMKPINLGFCMIRAVPYRTGWQALVHNAHPVTVKVTDERIEQEIADNGLRDVTLCSSDLMHTSKHGDHAIVHWNLEIDWTSKGEREMIQHERDKLDNYGPKEYAAGKLRTVQRLAPAILEMWRAWLAKAGAPRGAIRDIRLGGGQWIISRRGAGRLNQVSLVQPVQRLGSIEKDWFSRRERLALPEKAADVPQVPDVQPATALLRDARPDDDSGRGDAEAGVLVPHANEGIPENKLLDV